MTDPREGVGFHIVFALNVSVVNVIFCHSQQVSAGVGKHSLWSSSTTRESADNTVMYFTASNAQEVSSTLTSEPIKVND